MNRPLSFLAAFALSLLLCGLLLPLLKKVKAKQEILQYVTEHSGKQGTPTMGGIAFILAIACISAIFCDWSNRPTAVVIAVYADVAIWHKIRIPFTDKQIKMGFWIVPFIVFIYLACTNGVNLTDGIDGLATGTTICFLAGMIALLNRELILLESVGDTYAYTQTKDIITLCYIACGALSAFLLFNCNDAKVFMGDTGSLALGALVACSAIFTRMSLFIPILGLMFVVSCVSVILQVVYFKITKGKRIFLMAPFHHHLQKKKWSETRICVLYCTVTICITLIMLCFGE